MDHGNVYHIAEIISKYIKGNLTSGEQEELEDWRESSADHQKLLDEFSHFAFLEKKQIAKYLCGKEKAYQQFCLRQQAFLHRKKRYIWYRSIAALVVLSIGLTAVLYYRPEHLKEPIVVQQFLSAGESRAVLTLADGQKMYLGTQMADTLVRQAGVVMNTAAGCVKYQEIVAEPESVRYHQLDIPRKGEYKLVLSDGTRVWLNSETQLRYPVRFQGTERRVYLEGEAYFEVEKDEKMPFVVVAGQSAVQVLGTSFNIRGYTGEPYIYTTLVEGSVKLSCGRSSLLLKPDEQGTVDSQSGKLDKRRVDVRLYVSWRDGRFVFENQTLEEIMNTLGRWYDVNVFFTSEQVKKALFIGNLKRYDDFDKIVKMLELTGVAHFEIKGNTIVISE